MDYFALGVRAQKEILSTAATQMGLTEKVAEKDIWLCLVLRELFAMPDAKPMAFKGGTSLSKVYGVINRFSEDVDITIDYRSLGTNDTIEVLAAMANSPRKKITENLREAVKVYVHETIKPYFEKRLIELGLNKICEISVGDNGEEMKVAYQSLFQRDDDYLREHVLVEFGGRNIIDPNECFGIQPDFTDLFPKVIFPKASVMVLKAERTFWEKATLIHASCNKGIAQGRNRDSRHWYDLAKLAGDDIGVRAMRDFDLFADVVQLKNVFYSQKSAAYDKCLVGDIVLIPSGESHANLEADYAAMIDGGMLAKDDMSIESIFTCLNDLQEKINQGVLLRLGEQM